MSRPPTSLLLFRMASTTAVEREAVGRERVRVDRHLVLLLEAADRRDLGHARDRLERRSAGTSPGTSGGRRWRSCPLSSTRAYWKTQPTLVASGPSSVFTPCGRLALDLREVLEDARAGPVEVGAVLEDDVDVGEAEVGEAADRLDLRRAEEGGDDRVRDLVLEDVGAPVPARVDDDLRVREVGDGVERDLLRITPTARTMAMA